MVHGIGMRALEDVNWRIAVASIPERCFGALFPLCLSPSLPLSVSNAGLHDLFLIHYWDFRYCATQGRV
jgi:hypothetical protein